jgi:glutathione synthase
VITRSSTIGPAATEVSMDFVFVIDEIPSLLPGHDSSVALMEAAQRRGHRVLVTTAAELGFAHGHAIASCRQATLRPAVLHEGQWIADPEWFSLGPRECYRLDDAAVVFIRTDPPVNAQYLRATYLLDLIDPGRTLLVNSPAGVRNANEKLFALRVPELGPATLVTTDRRQIRDAVRTWGKAVLKPTDGMAGRGILVLDPADPNLASILDSATERGRVQVVVQQWLPASAEGDRRVIVLDGQPIGVVRRIACAGEFRCNMAVGARAVADAVTDWDRAICARLAPLLREYGLVLARLDVIGDCLTEINVTSPTGLREIDALTGSHLAADIVAWAESHCHATVGTS